MLKEIVLRYSRFEAPPVILGSFAAAWALLAGVLIARDPVLGVGVGLAPLLLLGFLRSSVVRVLAVSLGGMAVLGSSSDLGPNKLVYAGVLLICGVISAYRLLINPPVYSWTFRPAVWWGIALVATLWISYLASPAGSDIGTFGRQSMFYLLIVIGPVIGLDAGRDLKPPAVHALIGIIGTLAAVGFAADWLERRGVTALPVGRFVLSSLVLPAFAFGLAILMVFQATRPLSRTLWMVPSVAIPIAMLVTGTRTNLILFVVLLAVLGPKAKARVPFSRLLIMMVVVGTIGLLLFPVVAAVAVNDPNFITQRIQAAISAVSGGGDQSLSWRQAQATTASAMILESPVFGYGLGYVVSFTVDSPLLTVLRLGWVGTALVTLFIVGLSIAFHRGARVYGANPALTAWWGFLLVCLANLIFGTPLEDRGFGFAILLASMAIAASFQQSASPISPGLSPSSGHALRSGGFART